MDEITSRIRAECEQDEAVRHLVEFIEKSGRGVARG
jgi:acyl-[acyl carrier protein]--UDP-N-acetylglucosamine O-acyltransferase